MVEINLHDIRSFAEGKHRITDDYPYGGGGGMVLKVEPIARALETIIQVRTDARIVLLTPQGETLNQEIAEELSRFSQVVLISGHYEGVDERVRENLADREISIGDYVLTGGELPAMVVVDAVSRLIPEVLSNRESASLDSFSTGILEYPHYTRPREYKGWKVPDVLLSGNHKEINRWRRRGALKRTFVRRPDLLRKAKLSEEDMAVLRELAKLRLKPTRNEIT